MVESDLHRATTSLEVFFTPISLDGSHAMVHVFCFVVLRISNILGTALDRTQSVVIVDV